MTAVTGSVAASLLVGGIVALASPAAALGKPSISAIVPGDGRFTAEWGKVDTATAYQLQYATNSKFSSVKRINTSTTRKPVKELKNGTTYYVRVRAYDGSTYTYSRTRTVVPSSHKPGKVSAKVTGAGPSYPDSVNVSWSVPQYATKVKVVVSRDNAFLPSDGPRSGKYIGVEAGPLPTKLRVSVKSMPGWENVIGSRTANAVYARVIVYNGSGKAQSSIAFGFASPAAPVAGTPVKIASWNIQSYIATVGTSHTWASREEAITNSIMGANGADPDVLAVQEVTNTSNHRSIDDLDGWLAKNYVRADDDGGTRSGVSRIEDADGVVCQDMVDVRTENLSRDAHLYYKSSKLKVVEIPGASPTPQCGIHSTEAVAERYNPGYVWPSKVQDNYFAWAEFEIKASNERFFVVSVHPYKGDGEYSTARVKAVVGIHEFIKSQPDGASAPVLIVGDMNSDVKRDYNGAPTALVKLGFSDAAATKGRDAVYSTDPAERAEIHYGTSNNQSDDGYPAKPFVYAYDGTRIDHMMVLRASSIFYDNQVVLVSGYFDPDYQGSDHNLQNATINIPALVTGP